MRNTLLTLCFITLVFPATVSAYGKRPIGATRTMTRSSTTGMFIDRQVWLPGAWTVESGPETLKFRKTAPDKVHESIVSLKVIPRDQCGYGYVRIRALKSWGGRFLEQYQGRVVPISFGSSKYKGYSWVEASTWAGDQHWCVAMDLKNAMEITAPLGDTELMKFMQNDFLLQVHNRSGRSVLPWPTASGMSSSSSSFSY